MHKALDPIIFEQVVGHRLAHHRVLRIMNKKVALHIFDHGIPKLLDAPTVRRKNVNNEMLQSALKDTIKTKHCYRAC